jgi:hypothetical protein
MIIKYIEARYYEMMGSNANACRSLDKAHLRPNHLSSVA